MKKIILTILVLSMVAVLGVSLCACNNATAQGQFANILTDHNHEVFVYDAVNTKDNSEGTYTVRLDAFDKGAQNVNFGNRTLSNLNKGIRVVGKLEFGTTVYEMGCYYDLISGTSFMTPAYSFRTVSVDNVQTFAMQGKYSGSTFECERVVGENTFNDSVKLSGTFFDNNQFQQMLRSVTTFSSGLNLSFSTPIANADGLASATLVASGSSTTRVKDIAYTDGIEDLREEGINCYQISLSRSTQVAGISQTLYYAVDEIKSNGWGLKNVLIKIVEPFTADGQRYEMQYSLRSLSLS